MILSSYKNIQPKKSSNEHQNTENTNCMHSMYNKIDNFEAFITFPKHWENKNTEGLANVLDYFNVFFRNEGIVDCYFMDKNNFFSTMIDILINSHDFEVDITDLMNYIISHSPETIDYFLKSDKGNLLIQFLIENISLEHVEKEHLFFWLNIIYGIMRHKPTMVLVLYDMGLLDKAILLLKSYLIFELKIKKILLLILDNFLENNINQEKEITKNIFETYRDILLRYDNKLYIIISSSLENYIQKNSYSDNSYFILDSYSLFEIIYRCCEVFANDTSVNLEFSFSFLTYGLFFNDIVLRKKLIKLINTSFILDYFHKVLFETQNYNLFLSILVLLNNYYTIVDETINEINIQVVNDISMKIFDEGNIKLKKELFLFLINILNYLDINFLIDYIHYNFIIEIFHFLNESDKFYPDFYLFLNKLLQHINEDTNYIEIKNLIFDFLNVKNGKSEADENLYVENILNKYFRL